MRTMFLAFAATFFAAAAHAEPPKVVADVAPIHSLVAQVMDGVAEPVLLVPARTSPHGHALKVSQARALSDADIIFWVGETLTPWLEKTLDSLAGDALTVELLEVEDLSLLHFNEDGVEHHDEEDAHDREGVDPHIWLDPVNAKVMVNAITETLVAYDPRNEDRYRSNADNTLVKLDGLYAEIVIATAPIKSRRYIVYHDGYRYFEERFGLGRAFPISDSHAAKPGAKRLAEVRDALVQINPRCIFSEKQFGSRTVQSILRGTTASEAQLDPLGQSVEPGPALYGALIRDLSETMVRCLKP